MKLAAINLGGINLGGADLDAASLVRRLEPGEVLCRAGDRLVSAWQVREGALVVLADGVGETPVPVAEIGPGMLVGEITVLGGGVANATVTALIPTVVTELPADALLAWLDERPEIFNSIAAEAIERSNRSRTASLMSELARIDDGPTLARLIDVMTWHRFETGDVVFEQGDAADATYIVVSGRVAITSTDEQGDPALDLEFGRGALVGERGIIQDEPRAATVTATRNTTLARISREDFETLATAYPVAVIRIVRTILDHPEAAVGNNRSRAVAIAVTHPNPPKELGEWFSAEVERAGATSYLTATGADALLGRDGAAHAGRQTFRHERLSDMIRALELRSDYLLFDIEHENAADIWAKRCLAMSDRLVIFCSPQPSADEREHIEGLVAAASDVPGAQVWKVLIHSNGMQPSGGAASRGDERISQVLHIPHDERSGVERIARLSTGNGVGVVLGGGGARGFAHIGALQALDERNIPVDVLAGASIGSVMAAARAAGTRSDEMVGVCERFFDNLLDYTVPVVALLKSARITDNIESFFDGRVIEDAWIPLTCVSTNLTLSQAHHHVSGSMATAVRASVSIPAVLPPVATPHGLLVDGGVLDNLPVGILANDDRVGTVIAVDLEAPPDSTSLESFEPSVSGFEALRRRLTPGADRHPTILNTIIRSLLVGANRQREAVVASGDIDLHLVLHIDGVSLLDFDKVASTAAIGRREAGPQIDEWLGEKGEESPRN